MNLKPQTINPKPETPHPKLHTLNRRAERQYDDESRVGEDIEAGGGSGAREKSDVRGGGCPWRGRVGSYLAHLGGCEWARVTCAFCGKSPRRKDVDAHEATCGSVQVFSSALLLSHLEVSDAKTYGP